MSETQNNEAETISDLAQQAIAPDPVDAGMMYAVADGKNGVKIISTDEYAAHPRFATSHRKVLTAESFVAYVEKHGIPGVTEVWADAPKSTVVAKIDAHGGVGFPAGWEKHSLTLALELTPSWLAWLSRDGGTTSNGWWDDQEEFAEFIETRAIDVETPDAATLMEIILSIQTSSSGDFESTRRLEDGQVTFSYKETIGATAGQRGNLTIPSTIGLVLQPYVGGPRVRVSARFRFRTGGGHLKLGYVLERPQEVLDSAFADIVTQIRDGKSDAGDGKPTFNGLAPRFPILAGRPA